MGGWKIELASQAQKRWSSIGEPISRPSCRKLNSINARNPKKRKEEGIRRDRTSHTKMAYNNQRQSMDEKVEAERAI